MSDAPPTLAPEEASDGAATPPTPTVPRGFGPPALRAFLVAVLALVAATLTTGTALAVWVFLVDPGRGFATVDPGRGIAALDLSTQLIATALGYGPGLLVIAWAWHVLDGLPLSALGYVPPARRAFRGLTRGVGLGVLALSVVVALGSLAGGYRFAVGDVASIVGTQLTWVPVLLIVAHFEEVLFRAYVLQNLGRRRLALGVAISSLLFGAIHLPNPNVAGAGVAAVVLLFANVVLAGVWLATLYLRHGDLWWPTGAHLGWNWAQGPLFGLPVSGLELPGVLRGWVTRDGSLLFGGAFGPESSLLATVVLTSLVLEGLLARRRGGHRLPLETAWLSRAGVAPHREPDVEVT